VCDDTYTVGYRPATARGHTTIAKLQCIRVRVSGSCIRVEKFWECWFVDQHRTNSTQII